MQACCDQAQYLIKQNKYSEAETCLKAYLSLPTTKFDSDSSLWEEHGNINYPIALLAKVQALRKKTEESKVNYATACKPERNRPKYGIMAAMIDKTSADAALELHYEARALRLYLDASEKFNEMGAFRKEAEDCKDQANKLVPTGA